MTRFLVQYLFWLIVIYITLYTLSSEYSEFQIFRYAGF